MGFESGHHRSSYMNNHLVAENASCPLETAFGLSCFSEWGAGSTGVHG